MTFQEVFRRVILQHRALILITPAVVLGAFFLFGVPSKTYTASARLVLDTPDPSSRQESGAIADTGKAIATSPAEVQKALDAAHVHRDATDVARNSVSVSALGSSGVLQLSVTDRNRRAAAATANALAAEVIKTRLSVTRGESRATLAGIATQITALDKRIASTSTTIATLGDLLASGTGSTQSVTARRDSAIRNRDLMTTERSTLEAERVDLLAANATKLQPQVISAAAAPQHADSSHLGVDVVLATVLGLMLGVALAGIRETVRPTYVGQDALASAFGAPFLGAIETIPGKSSDKVSPAEVGQRVALAARAAGHTHVELVAAGPDLDLGPLAAQLALAANGNSAANGHGRPGSRPAVGHRSGNGNGDGNGRIAVDPFKPLRWPVRNGGSAAIVVVTPVKLTQREYLDASNLLAIAGAGRLGVITYANSERDPYVDRPARKSIRRTEAAG
jgi:capsular polysaccharide biosynthesis protein